MTKYFGYLCISFKFGPFHLISIVNLIEIKIVPMRQRDSFYRSQFMSTYLSRFDQNWHTKLQVTSRSWK